MNTSWDHDGLLFGSLTGDECANGGKWMIGDIFTSDEPGHSKIVQYKSWVARKDKYRPGSYPFKDRCDSGMWEYVLMMQGAFVAIERGINDQTTRFSLLPGSVVEFPPDASRSWELEPDHDEARGCTILWSGEGMRTDEGLGGFLYGFCFESWTSQTAAKRLYRTSEPLELFTELDLRVQLVEVFNGSMLCQFGDSKRIMNSGDHAYVKVGTKVCFEPRSSDTYGITMYYK